MTYLESLFERAGEFGMTRDQLGRMLTVYIASAYELRKKFPRRRNLVSLSKSDFLFLCWMNKLVSKLDPQDLNDFFGRKPNSMCKWLLLVGRYKPSCPSNNT